MIRRTTVKKTQGFYNDDFFPGFGIDGWLNHVFDEAIGSDVNNHAGDGNNEDNKPTGDGNNHVGDDNDDVSNPRPNDEDIVSNLIDNSNNDFDAEEDLEIDPRKDEEETMKQ